MKYSRRTTSCQKWRGTHRERFKYEGHELKGGKMNRKRRGKKKNKTWRENSTLSSCALYLTCAGCSGLFTSRQSQRISRFSIRGHKKRRKGKKKICFPSNKNRIICGAQRWSKLNPAEQRFRGRQGHVGRAWPLHQAFRNISTVPFWRQYGSTRADNHHQLLLGRAGKKRFFALHTHKKRIA